MYVLIYSLFMVQKILLVTQIIISVSLVVLILLQQKGSGVGGVFGGESAVYRSRRGVEKMLHYGTIVCAILLGVISLTLVFYAAR